MPFIVFEGMDACGKGTQAERLVKTIGARAVKFPTYATEPLALCGPVITDALHGKWCVGSRRDVGAVPGVGAAWQYLPPEDPKLDAFVRQCVFAVNKCEMAPIIESHLDHGTSVICDRYWPSAYAFGAADGIDPTWLLRIHEMLPVPDIMFLLDIDYEDSLARRPDRRDMYEKRGKGFHDQVAGWYRKLWLEVAPPSCFWTGRATRWIILDGREPVDTVAGKVLDEIDRMFGRDLLKRGY